MCRRLEDSLVFSYCPLNNSFPTPYMVGNLRYVSALQEYVMSKALHFKDYESWHQAIFTDCSKQLRSISAKIMNFILDEWELVAADRMRDCITHKFNNNESARAYLLNTGKACLIYASTEHPYWSVGLDFADNNVMDKSCWNGYNFLGILLQELRDSM